VAQNAFNDVAANFLSELSAVLAGNLQAVFDKANAEEGAALDPAIICGMYLEVLEQNTTVLQMYEDRFSNTGEPVLAAWCARMREDTSRQIAILDQESDPLVVLQDFTSGVISALDAEKGLFSLGLTGEKTLYYLSKGLDAADVFTKVCNGDLSAALCVFAGSYINSFVTGVFVAAAVSTGVVSWPVLAGIAAIGSIAGVIGGNAVNDLLENFEWFKDPEDRREENYRLIVAQIANGGSSYLPALGDYLVFGTADDDQLDAQYSTGYSSMLIGGNGNDILQGAERIDRLSGGAGVDTLYGHEGNDMLDGGDGDDRLVGGSGSDRLVGGDGFDIYEFDATDFNGFSQDVIVDSDGAGKVTFDSIAIGDMSVNGVSRDGLAWKTRDGVFRLYVISSDETSSLVITHRASGARIVIRDWSNGGLGITLPGLGELGTPENPVVQTNGDDLIGRDGAPDAAPSGDNFISALAGNDGIDGGYGDDWIDGGDGDDLILGGSGSNRLIGGFGSDIIMGMPVVMNWQEFPFKDSEYAQLAARSDVHTFGNGWYSVVMQGIASDDATDNLRLEIYAQYANSNSPWKYVDANVNPNGDDEIDAGEGSDTAYGGEGDDLVSGGTGNDLLLGGSDNDSISGDEGDDIILGDDLPSLGGIWSYIWDKVSASANASGDDMLSGGEGNDRVYGQGGSDLIEGGDGDDVLQGDRVDYGLQYSYEAFGVAGNDYIDGGAGNDQIIGDGGDDTLLGGAGDDVLVGDSYLIAGAEHGNDEMDGGSGNDTLVGLGANDVLRGGDGDDLLVGDGAATDLDPAYNGDDSLYGGAGNDELQGGGGNDTLDGGTGKDLLFGQDGDDFLLGGEGDDELQGGIGNDALFGEAGDDKLFGQEGNDVLNGDEGNDIIQGGAGDDRLSGGDGSDQLLGEEGSDTIDGGNGSDIIDGGDGDDLIRAGQGNDSVYGGIGRDVIHAEEGDDFVGGDDGDDEIHGGIGNDVLHGAAGNDIVNGDEGDDVLVGGAGDDLLIGGIGNNSYYFDRGFGNDEVKLTAGSQEVIGFRDGISIQELQFLRVGDDLSVSMVDGSVVLLAGYFAQGVIAYIQLADGSILTQGQVGSGGFYRPVILGTEGADAINGTSGSERIYGLAGNDTLDGKGGDDLLNGGTGDDRFLFGTGRGHDVIEDVGAGTDTIVLDADIAVSAITLTVGNHGDLVVALPGGTDTLTVSGYFKATGDPLSILFASGERWSRQQILGKLAKTSAGTYTGADLVGEEVADDTLVGSSGADSLYGKAGQDVLFGMDGNDYLYGDDANYLLAFANNSDFLYGGNGNDRLYGYFGNDYLEGGAGTDYLYGNEGNDVLIGGAGSDYLYGGVGVNTYRFATGFGVDTLSVDYAGQETARLVFDDALASQVTVTRSGNALQVRSGSDVVTIDNYASQPASVSLQFKDGTVWDWYTINALINVGTAASDTLRGTDRADVLDGKGGSDTLYGGAGNDQLFGGADNDYLYGEAGDDVLDGGAGNDQLQGGDGYDTYVLARGQGSDRITDGTSAIRVATGVAPADLVATLVDGGYYYQLVLSIAGSTEALTFDLDLSGSAADGVALPFDRVEFADGTVWDAQAVRAFLAPTILLGTNTDDTLLGTGGADRAYGFGGADEIVTLAGDDRVFGGAGNDQLDGGAGADILHGDADDDQLLGGDGDDTLEGGAGSDVVVGGAGRDYVFGDASFGSGSDQLDGNDVLQGGAGDDELDGGLGNDVFLFNLGDGQDVIVDGSTAYNPYTNHRDPGFDVIRFGAGIAPEDLDFSITYRDAVGGQDGDLVIHNRVSGDTVTVKYVLLSKGYSGGGGKLSTIDRVEFFDGATIDFTEMLARAGYLGNRIDGTAGDDNLQGTAGEDILDGKGDISQDNLSGGGGSDVYLFGRNSGRDYIYDSYYGYNPVTYTWEYTPEDGIDVVRFDADVAPSDLFVDPYYRGIGISGSSALLSKWQGIEQFQFADGTIWDQAAIHSFINTPTEGDNTIAGTEGDDNLDGLGGNDALYGYGGNDVLHGGSGDDNLYAGDGNDVMRYALGDGLDRIAGGAGYDVLEFGPGISAADLVVGRQFGELYLTLGDTGQGVVISEVYSYDPSDSTMQTGNLELLRFADGTEMSLSDFVPDFHSGNPGPQEIYGSAGDDLIDGQGGNDFIHGLGGNDELRGGAGNDVLYGEAGDDLLIGGDGEDSYEINPGDGHDRIDNRNTDGSRDVAEFYYDAADLSVNRAGSDLVVTFSGSTDSVTFQYWFDDASARVDGVWTNDAYLSADDLEALIPESVASAASAESPAELHELVSALAGFTSGSSVSLAESEDVLTAQALAYSSPSTTRLANMRVFTPLS